MGKKESRRLFGHNNDIELKNESELADMEIKKIARDELNNFLDSQGKHSIGRKSVLDEHLQNNDMIEELSNSIRNKRIRFERLGNICRDQVSSAKKRAKALKFAYPNSPLPKHEGYSRLIRLLEENEEYPYILELCIEAKEQGWKGPWDEDIKRVKKKMKDKSRTR